MDGLLQIGICDDARESRFQLRVLLERALEGRSAPARLLEFSSGDALLGWMDRHAGELDLVFLDIEMEGTNGMDTARALREADQSLQLVFVTGYSDYVFDGYEVGALGYLLKPAGAEELEKVLTRALTALQRQEEELFFCRSGEVFYRIRRDAILYFRSDRRQVTCVTPRRLYFLREAGPGGCPAGGGVRPHPPAVSGPGGGGGPGDRERGVGRGGDPAHQPLLPAGGAACLDTGGAGVGREWE